MDTIRKLGLSLSVALILSGCAARRYQSVPIVPTETASTLESRSLGDPGLRAFVEKSVGHAVTPWPPKAWDSAILSLAALYFSPALDAARARVAESQAAIVTAGARPNPSMSKFGAEVRDIRVSTNEQLAVPAEGDRDRPVRRCTERV
jgi:hypothetical protein